LIQVVQNLDHPATRDREVRALTDATNSLGLSHGLILSDADAPAIEADGGTIEIRSLAGWLIAP